MLNLTGDTAVYLLYAHARLVSIIRKSGQDTRQIVLTSKGNCCVPTEEKAEWNLVKYLSISFINFFFTLIYFIFSIFPFSNK